MNKSIGTNLLALLLTVAAVYLELDALYYVGIFALAGAVTNWLAIHMLFEKVPGLYGSGVIPARFKEFKLGIKIMIMEQFFNAQNIEKFMHSEAQAAEISLQPVIEQVDFAPTFESLVEVIQDSSFGSMLEMLGGRAALEPMREPFIEKMKQSIVETTKSESFKQLLARELEQPAKVSGLIEKVELIVEQRLQELTPLLVKEIVQKMIKKHLGWLVVWGGVFGGAIGGVASLWA